MLYIVSTPIGNLGDISERAIETLKNADLIAAEDTRHTLGMLTHFDIKKPLVSYYEENKVMRGPELIKKLQEGVNIALVSDAGTPGISDPGSDLIKSAIENNIQVTCVPGCAACITAVVLSGFNTRRFVFEGFLPVDKKEKKEVLEEIASEKRTLVMYEAPHRLMKTLETLNETVKGRKVAVCRELTKKFEEVKRGYVPEIIKSFEEDGVRGEFVIVIEGLSEAGITDEKAGDAFTEEDVAAFVTAETDSGKDKKTALKAATEKFGISRNDVYRIVEEMKNRE